MKIKLLTSILWLWILVPSVAHASSFALVLYPLGTLTAIVISSVVFAGGRRFSVRVGSALIAALTAACVFLLPASFNASMPFQFLQSWLGEWVFFFMGLVPAVLMAFLLLRIGARATRRHDA